MEKDYVVDEETGSHLVLLVQSIRKRLPLLESIRLRELNAISLDVETIKGGAEILSFDALAAVMDKMTKIVADSLANTITSAQSSVALIEQITIAEDQLNRAMAGPKPEALNFLSHSPQAESRAARVEPMAVAAVPRP
ncbi:MAG: hypothetical protein EOP07_24395, partial [Proteobacteria bacterium]